MTNDGTPAPALDEEIFKQGMALLSGALDWDGVPAEQVMARMQGHWIVLRGYSTAAFQDAVRKTLRTRTSHVHPTTGMLAKPGIPTPADLADLCEVYDRQARARLAPPPVVPAPPEVARAAVTRIKAALAASRGPLSGTLGQRTDAGFAPPPPREPADAPAPRPPLRVIPGGRR